jgi:hypothetical protein
MQRNRLARSAISIAAALGASCGGGSGAGNAMAPTAAGSVTFGCINELTTAVRVSGVCEECLRYRLHQDLPDGVTRLPAQVNRHPDIKRWESESIQIRCPLCS